MLRILLNKALWLTMPPALGILFAIVANSGLTDEGIIVGHPITRIVHVYSNDVLASEVQTAIPNKQVRVALTKPMPIRDVAAK